MEKQLKSKRIIWADVYEITEPFRHPVRPSIYVELGVKYCPNCGREYFMRFRKIFECLRCNFKYNIKTPISTKLKVFKRWLSGD